MGSDGANDNSTSVGVVHGNNQNIMNVLAQINLIFFLFILSIYSFCNYGWKIPIDTHSIQQETCGTFFLRRQKV